MRRSWVTARNGYWRRTFLATLLMCSIVHASEVSRLTAQLPDIDAPPQGQAQWVARSMRMNGLPMTIKSFQTSLSTDEVLNFYEHWWTGKALAQYSRSRQGEWRMLGIHSDKYAITIEVRSTLGGAEGTIAVSPKLGKVERVATTFPHPISAAVVNLQEYDDAGVEAEYISMASTRSVSAEAHDFVNLLERDGWQLIIDRRARVQADAYIIEAQKGASHAQLTFKSNAVKTASTAIAIVWRKS